MMKKLCLCVFAVFLTSCAQLFSPSMRHIGTSDNGLDYYLDESSARYDNKKVTFRTLAQAHQPIVPPQEADAPPYTQFEAIWRIDCDAVTYSLLSMKLRDEKGNLVHERTVNSKPQKIQSTPNPAKAQFQILCYPLYKKD